MFGSMEGAEAGAAAQAATPVTVSSTGSDKAGKATADVATDVTTTVTAEVTADAAAGLTAGLLDRVAGLDGAGLSDAELISGIDTLEQAKAACAAAQVRLTARFVQSQAQEAARLRGAARACSDAGDFDGWVLARDRAASLELEPPVRDAPGRPRHSAQGASDAAGSGG